MPVRLLYYPDAPCMPYMPTLGWFGGPMAYMVCLGFISDPVQSDLAQILHFSRQVIANRG